MKSKSIFAGLAALLCLSLSVSAKGVTPDKVLKLYPEGQDADTGIVENGVAITLGPLENNGMTEDIEYQPGRYGIGDSACLEIFIPKKCNGQMVVCCPGGGYKYVCVRHEGYQVAEWMLKQGIAVCMVRYRMPNHHHAIPVRDVQNAFRYCRYHARDWGVKQIGIIGFSAGGHLAASASNMYVDEVTKPDFSVLIYPVITLALPDTHKGTRSNLTGGKPSLVEYYSLQNRVTADTPKTFLALSQDDKTVPAINSILYYEKLLQYKVPSEIHIFTNGGHGWGFNHGKEDSLTPNERADFEKLLARWLADRRKEM